jgi:hypothetical protein
MECFVIFVMAWCWFNATESKPQNVSGNTRATQNAERKPHKKIENLNRKKEKSFANAKPFLF